MPRVLSHRSSDWDPRRIAEVAIFDGTVSHSMMLAVQALEDQATALKYRLPGLLPTELEKRAAKAEQLRDHAERLRLLRATLLELSATEERGSSAQGRPPR